ncbi:flavodoxin family protein [Demequina pelophila]|uniref:flavodoxin family protein n=1 Tax=Demequina pelophila TaxID=1638984 RepID=UPI000784E441|nr:hypothetical protein [Demequina pelophila]
MNVVIVFESLWGNTAAIARAIADGVGESAHALSTAEATPDVVAAAGLVIAGAPVHAMGLPSEHSRESASRKPQGAGHLAADLSHPPMRDWLDALPAGPRLGAAFETRIRGPLGRGAASGIAHALESHGLTLIDGPRSFNVHLKTSSSESAALLFDGELDAAREWGELLSERALARR